MGFKLLILNPSEPGDTAYVDTWPEKLRDEISDIDVQLPNRSERPWRSLERLTPPSGT